MSSLPIDGGYAAGGGVSDSWRLFSVYALGHGVTRQARKRQSDRSICTASIQGFWRHSYLSYGVDAELFIADAPDEVLAPNLRVGAGVKSAVRPRLAEASNRRVCWFDAVCGGCSLSKRKGEQRVTAWNQNRGFYTFSKLVRFGVAPWGDLNGRAHKSKGQRTWGGAKMIELKYFCSLAGPSVRGT